MSTSNVVECDQQPPQPRARPAIAPRNLIAGLPSALAALGLLATLVWASVSRSPRLYYAERASLHERQGNDAGLLVCLKRLLVLEPDRPDQPDRLFKLARTYARLGLAEQGEAVARSIAPPDEPGHRLAHEWLAIRAFLDAQRRPGRAREAEAHLVQLLRAYPVSAGTRAVLGLLYALTGQHAKARDLLLATADDDPVLLLTLSNSCAQVGDLTGARLHLTEAREAAARVSRAHPNDPEPRLVWARICVTQGDHQAALDLLDEGKAARFPSLRREKAVVYAAWADALRRSGKSTISTLLSLIERGLNEDPACEPLLLDLSYLIGTGGTVSETARAALPAMLAQPRLAAPVRYAQGAEAAGRGRLAEARQLWEDAYQFDPDIPVLTNNLAYTLAFTEPSNSARALALVNRALEATQGDLRIRVTRAQILGKVGRWKDAVAELEGVLEADPKSKEAHEALADIYDHLGQPREAAEHRKTR